MGIQQNATDFFLISQQHERKKEELLSANHTPQNARKNKNSAETPMSYGEHRNCGDQAILGSQFVSGSQEPKCREKGVLAQRAGSA